MTLDEFTEMHDDVDRVTEHGQDWLICKPCGAMASIVDTSNDEEAEIIEDGDGTCKGGYGLDDGLLIEEDDYGYGFAAHERRPVV